VQTHKLAKPRGASRSFPSVYAVLTADAPQQSQKAVVLPPSLQNNVVVLDAPNEQGNTTKVYLMGISHVSKQQCAQVKELIRLVKPEVVMVELCKDRVGLLVDYQPESQASNLWHSRKVFIEGLPTEPEWPTAQQLKTLIQTRAGRPVSTQDIEADVYSLLATGLFKSVRPAAESASYDEVPEFGVRVLEDGSAGLLTIPPLNAIKFIVQERVLPAVTQFSVRVDSSLKNFPVAQEKLDAIGDEIIAECKKETPALHVLLRARGKFEELIGTPVAVAYSNLETGKVEAVVKAIKASDKGYVSGFESSAVNGEGWGIDPFRPARPLTKISNKMFLTTETLESLRAQARAGRAAPVADEKGEAAPSRIVPTEPRTSFRAWTDEEMASPAKMEPERMPLADALSATMTLLYARSQATVGGKVGVDRGEAWRAAFEAACEVGTQQFVLSDRPAKVTDWRLGVELLQAAGVRLGGAVTALLGSIVAAAVMDQPLQVELGGVAVGSATALALMWPLLKPYFDIQRLADMSAAEIEDAVSVKEPLGSGDLSKPVKLFGEDALLDWPGAQGPLLDERDEFMARALAGSAEGTQGLCPAYVRDEVNGQTMWRLMQAQGAPPESSPKGLGDAEYTPIKGARAVVKVVGTAHVRGMMRAWDKALKQPADVQHLLKTSTSTDTSSTSA